MDFKLSAEQQMAQRMGRKFAEEELLPGVIARDEAKVFDMGLVKKLGEAGLHQRCHARHHRVRSDDGRQRLHAGIPCGADVPGRQNHPDLRRHQRDSAADRRRTHFQLKGWKSTRSEEERLFAK